MAIETTPVAQGSTGNWRITYSPSGTGLSAAILVGGTAKDFTYSFTPDGFNRNFTEEKVTDARLTMAQVLESPGSYLEAIEVTYVESATAGSASVTLVDYATGLLSIRRGVDNATVWTIGQKADVVTFKAGKRRPNAPTANGLDTISQTLYLTAPTVTQGTITA